MMWGDFWGIGLATNNNLSVTGYAVTNFRVGTGDYSGVVYLLDEGAMCCFATLITDTGVVMYSS